MAQLTDDCFAFGDRLIPIAEALERVEAVVPPIEDVQPVPLSKALGRVLAADLTAETAVPPGDNSAVDGYAVFFDDLSPGTETILPVVERAAAGHPFPRPQRRGEAVRIFTGALMPKGVDGQNPDTVMMQEDCRRMGGRVIVPPGIKRGANRRFAGEDLTPGDLIATAGTRLRPQEIGLAASLGHATVQVRRAVRVAVFSTGDEVNEPGRTPREGGIYDANRYALMGLLTGLGCIVDDLGILPDQPGAILAALARAAERNDVVVTSGGVSGGDEDHVKAAVEALGDLHAWRLAIKPGRPVAIGQIGQTPFLGLPGNPVATMITFLKIARPLILRRAGARAVDPRTYPVIARFSYAKKTGRREFVRVRLERENTGWTATRFDRDGAGILSSLAWAEGLVELAEDTTSIADGDIVDYLPFSEVGL